MRMESPLNQRLRWSPPDVVYTPIDVTSDGQLILTKAHPPEIDSRPMQQFAQDTLKGVTTFSEKFLALLHEKAVSNP